MNNKLLTLIIVGLIIAPFLLIGYYYGISQSIFFLFPNADGAAAMMLSFILTGIPIVLIFAVIYDRGMSK